jgi:uncharacterized protein (TIGR00730 family)
MSELPHAVDGALSLQNSWRILRIVSELVQGYDTFTNKGPFISFFGSTRLPQDHKYCKLAQNITEKVIEQGFSVITGAGPGIMEMVNKTAYENKAISAGLIPDLPSEPTPNKYLDPQYSPRFKYFFVRKVMFVRYAQGFVFLPGGYGTLDELFEILTLVQTKRTLPVPIYLAGKDYWNGLVSWLRQTQLGERCIDERDLQLFTISDDPAEIADGLVKAYRGVIQLEEDIQLH